MTRIGLSSASRTIGVKFSRISEVAPSPVAPTGSEELSGVRGREKDEIEVGELRECPIRRNHLVAARVSKCGQIGIHPKLYRRGVSHGKLPPETLDPRRFTVMEVDPIVSQERFVDSPRLEVRQRWAAIWGHDGGSREESKERLLCRTAKEN